MFSKKLKKLMGYFCAAACAVTVLAPASQTQAATNSFSWKNFNVENPFDGTSAKSFAKSSITTASTESYSVPVASTLDSLSTIPPMTIYGSITPGVPETYTITLPKDMNLTGAFSVSVDQGSVFAELTDAKGNLITNSSSSVTSTEASDFSKSFVSAGTYTLTISSSSATGTFAVQMFGIDGSKSGTIKAGTTYVGYNNSTTYKKFTVSSNRLVAIAANEPSGSYTIGKYVTVCNSKKKAISAKSYTSSSDKFIKYYGLKKGTYYVKLSSSGLYCLQLANSTKGTLATTSKKKAKTITSSFKNYIVPASTSKSSAYFKYTFKKSAKKTLRIRYTGNYSVKATVYRGKKAVASRTLTNGSDWEVFYQNSLTRAKTKWPKGTYTVKIQKSSKNDSGLISIRMK